MAQVAIIYLLRNFFKAKVKTERHHICLCFLSFKPKLTRKRTLYSAFEEFSFVFILKKSNSDKSFSNIESVKKCYFHVFEKVKST